MSLYFIQLSQELQVCAISQMQIKSIEKDRSLFTPQVHIQCGQLRSYVGSSKPTLGGSTWSLSHAIGFLHHTIALHFTEPLDDDGALFLTEPLGEARASFLLLLQEIQLLLALQLAVAEADHVVDGAQVLGGAAVEAVEHAAVWGEGASGILVRGDVDHMLAGDPPWRGGVRTDNGQRRERNISLEEKQIFVKQQ